MLFYSHRVADSQQDLDRRYRSHEGGLYLFLQIVKETAPQVLEDLAGRPLFRLQRLVQRLNTHMEAGGQTEAAIAERLYRAIAEGRVASRSVSTPRYLIDARRLAGLLDTWQARWNLNSEWMRETAETTLRVWASDPGVRAALLWSPVAATPMPYERSPLNLTPPPDLAGWSPHDGRLAVEYRASVNSYVSATLDEYIARQQDGTESEPPPTSPRRFHRETYARLVRFQCLDASFTAMAAEAGLDTRTISVPVRNLARFLDLSLRKSPRGRPAKPHPGT